MSERQRIVYAKADEREALVVILTRNGYSVRAGREVRDGKATGKTFVEYWTEGGSQK